MTPSRSLAVVVLLALAVAVACGRGRPAKEAPTAAPPAPAAGPRLITATFDGANPLAPWQQVDGAVDGSGQGPPSTSTIALDDGGVRLEGAADTTRWRALEQTVALASASWVRVAARMRTDGLVADGVHRPQCYVYSRFTDASGQRLGALLATRNLLGTTPWAPVARRFPVPAGAVNLTVGLFLSLPGRAWFDDLEVEAAPAPDWHETTDGHYHYHWLGGDQLPDPARRYNTESYRMVAEFLGLDPAGSPDVAYYKYPDKAIKEELMGDPGNAFTMPDGSMHSIFATDRHEIVHVLARPWGDPPALVAEGLAVHLSGSWQGKPVVTYARGLLDHDWIPLADLLDSGAFRNRPDLVTYAIAGGFVEWTLAQPDGHDRLRRLYGQLQNRASAAANRQALEAILGATVEDTDARVRAWLSAGGAPAE